MKFLLLVLLALAARAHSVTDDDFVGDDDFADVGGEDEVEERIFKTGSKNYRWPDGVVVYRIDSSIPSEHHQLIRDAAGFLEDVSCVDFVERTDEEVYIDVHSPPDDSGCYASTGYRSSPLPYLKLCDSRCFTFGTVVHELSHSLGQRHEQQRPDRDSHVKINWSKIEPAKRRNFYKKVLKGETPGVDCDTLGDDGDFDSCDDGTFVETFGLPYDLDSKLHYSHARFSTDGSSTIEAKTAGVGVAFGRSPVPTLLDQLKLNKAYGCLPSCHNFFQAESGVMDGTGEGEGDAVCRWDILVPKGKHVLIQFHTFDFVDCNSTVTVRTPSDPVSSDRVFCSTSVPGAVVVYEHQATVVLNKTADRSNGFYATYTAIDGKDPCCHEVRFSVPQDTESNFYDSANSRYDNFLGSYRKDGTHTKDEDVEYPVYIMADDDTHYLAHDDNVKERSRPWIIGDDRPGDLSGSMVWGSDKIRCPSEHSVQRFYDRSLDPRKFVSYDGVIECVDIGK